MLSHFISFSKIQTNNNSWTLPSNILHSYFSLFRSIQLKITAKEATKSITQYYNFEIKSLFEDDNICNKLLFSGYTLGLASCVLLWFRWNTKYQINVNVQTFASYSYIHFVRHDNSCE